MVVGLAVTREGIPVRCWVFPGNSSDQVLVRQVKDDLRSLSAEDIALGYKQLIEVERGWRTLKHTLDLRPVYHRKDERIRAHVLLCFLALLLTRVIEVETNQSWPTIRRELQRMHLGEFHGSAGRVLQRTETTTAQRDLLRALQVDEPPRFLAIEPAKAA
jgi:transposase